MPVPWRSRIDRAGGPTPFTTDWINEAPEPSRPGRVAPTSGSLSIASPSWLPPERLLTALLVLILVLTTTMLAGSREQQRRLSAPSDDTSQALLPGGIGGGTAPSAAAGEETANADGSPIEEEPAVSATEDDVDFALASTNEPTADRAEEDFTASETPVPTTAAIDISRPSAPPADGSILPYYRVITYYGHPHADTMGILGEYGVTDDLDGLRAALEDQAAEYELTDPNRPIKLAFEVIATVAQGDAMSDGSWLLSTDSPTIQRYIDYAAKHDMLVILDVQIGRRGVPDEIELIRKWLEYPHVHLALDPEFSMEEGQIPGEHIGQIDAADILYAQQYLVDLCEALGLPPKILVVHQFHYTMIANKDQVRPFPGVQLVIDMDGHGPPPMKRETYAVMNTEHPIEFNGVKLFYKFDQPILTAPEIVSLDPIPDLVIYQ